MLQVRSFFIFSLSRIYVLRTFQVIINLIFSGKNLLRIPTIGLIFHSWMGPKGPYTSKVSTVALLSYNENIWTVLALSSILFRFLALYRPGFRDWGTVNGTQTGISNIHCNILLQNLRKLTYLRKINISSSLSCNPTTGWLDSALSPTW